MLSDAVRTLNLMDPSRSTLKENISPCASITLDDITTHLNDLAWRECCITSIDVINNTNTDIDNSQLSEYFAGKCRDSSASTSLNLGSEIGEVATKMVTKRKRSSTWLTFSLLFDSICRGFLVLKNFGVSAGISDSNLCF